MKSEKDSAKGKPIPLNGNVYGDSMEEIISTLK
jgi:hypothetical protein